MCKLYGMFSSILYSFFLYRSLLELVCRFEHILVQKDWMVSLKKWQWLIASIVFVIIYSCNYYGDLATKRVIHSIVYSSDDLVMMRKAVVSILSNDEQQLPVSADRSINQLQLFQTIDRFNDGFLLAYDEPFVLHALYDGMIVFTGHTKYNGKTISIVYDTGATVTFGFVDDFYVLPYTTVTQGMIVATKKSGELYIQIERDGQILNMEQTIRWLKEQPM